MSHPVAVIVEDEPQIRRFVRAALEGEGWVVHEAGTQQRGLAEAGTRKPDLLIVDLGLPDGDGMDLIRDVRGWSTVPIIVLSARGDETDKIAALDAGEEQRGLDALIDAISDSQDASRREELRRAVVGVLDQLGVEHPVARESRRKLASALY